MEMEAHYGYGKLPVISWGLTFTVFWLRPYFHGCPSLTPILILLLMNTYAYFNINHNTLIFLSTNRYNIVKGLLNSWWSYLEKIWSSVIIWHTFPHLCLSPLCDLEISEQPLTEANWQINVILWQLFGFRVFLHPLYLLGSLLHGLLSCSLWSLVWHSWPLISDHVCLFIQKNCLCIYEDNWTKWNRCTFMCH